MSLKDDKQQNIQMQLDFSNALPGEARDARGEETESSKAASGLESQARTALVNKVVFGKPLIESAQSEIGTWH
jgi:hypothetical protein